MAEHESPFKMSADEIALYLSGGAEPGSVKHEEAKAALAWRMAQMQAGSTSGSVVPDTDPGPAMPELEPEQQRLLAQMVEGARGVARQEQEWVMIRYGRGVFLEGPGIGREEVVEGDVRMLEREALIEAIRFSRRQGNPTYVLTPQGRSYYTALQGNDPGSRQDAELRRFLDSETFKADYPRAYAKWSGAEILLWQADSEGEFTTVGHKVREALQEFATEAIARYAPADVEANPASVNLRLGAIIAEFRPTLGEARAKLLIALGNYSEATLAIVQRQEHGAQKEGQELT